MANQMDKTTDNAMDTEIIAWFHRDNSFQIFKDYHFGDAHNYSILGPIYWFPSKIMEATRSSVLSHQFPFHVLRSFPFYSP